MARSLSRAQVFDAGTTPPGSQIRRVNVGTAISPEWKIEKLPPGKWRKWVDAHGNVKRVAYGLSDGKLNRDREAAMEKRHRRAGGVPYDVCPLRDADSRLSADDFLQAQLKHACEMWEVHPATGARTRVFGPERACPHVEHIISVRQAARKKWCAEHDAQINAEAEARKHRDALLEDAVLAIKEGMSAGGKRKARKPKAPPEDDRGEV